VSVETPYTYPRAPILVTPAAGRPIQVEVDSEGFVEITFEYSDPSWANRDATSEAYVSINAADWASIVAHVARDMTKAD